MKEKKLICVLFSEIVVHGCFGGHQIYLNSFYGNNSNLGRVSQNDALRNKKLVGRLLSDMIAYHISDISWEAQT